MPSLYVDQGVGVTLVDASLAAARTPTGDTLTGAFVSGGFVRLERAHVTATHHGIALRKHGSAHVVDCVLASCGKTGLEADAGRFVVRGSEVRGAGLHGIARFSGLIDSVVERTVVVDAVEGGIVAKARMTVRDTRVERAGKFAVLGTESLVLEHVAATGSKGWGLLVDGEKAHVHVEECILEGSQSANVDVKKGFLSLSGAIVRGGATSGVILQAEARAVLARTTIEDNAQGNVYALDGARHVVGRCTIRGGSLGFWSRGSAGFVEDTLIEGAGIQVLGEHGPTFLRCEVRGAGIDVSGAASPIFSHCAVTGAEGAGFSLAEGTSAVLEACRSEGNGAPDALGGSENLAVSLDAAALSIAEDDGALTVTVREPDALTALFHARGATPPPDGMVHLVGYAIGAALNEAKLEGEVEMDVEGATLHVRTDDAHARDVVRAAAERVIAEPRRILFAADGQAVIDLVRELSS
jgi:hypothetical protein